MSFDRSENCGSAQQQAYGGLFSFANEKREHCGYSFLQSYGSQLPTIRWATIGICTVQVAKWSPYVASSNLAASIEKDFINACRRQLRVNVDAFFGNSLKRSLAFYKTSKPSPFDFCRHGKIDNMSWVKCNPKYAEMARRRITADAPLFAEAAE